MKSKFIENFSTNGFVVLPLNPNSTFELEALINENRFILKELSTDEFREKLLEIQTKINTNGFIKNFVRLNFETITTLLGTDKISHTGAAYLRGVRPSQGAPADYLDFHRERFYTDGDYIKHQINIHIPLIHYNESCSMRYVPYSHLIPDADLITNRLDEGSLGIGRASNGHLLGLSYAPKKIISGVDLSKAVGAPVIPGQYMLFNTNLIHGSGKNNTQDIRFSIDFGVIADHNLGGAKEYSTASYLNTKKPYISYYET